MYKIIIAYMTYVWQYIIYLYISINVHVPAQPDARNTGKKGEKDLVIVHSPQYSSQGSKALSDGQTNRLQSGTKTRKIQVELLVKAI